MKIDNPKNTNNNSFFKRCPTELQHPFVMLPRALIVDANISIPCRWLITYLLSLPPDKTISMPQIQAEQKMSKDRMYSLVNEAIEHGYLKRDCWLEEGKKRYCYTVSQEPKFKNVVLFPENQDAAQFPENQDTETSLKLQTSLGECIPNTREGVRIDRGYRGKKGKREGPSEIDPEKVIEFVHGPIRMKLANYEKLVTLHGKSLIDDITEDMVLYSHTHPQAFAKYDSHYHVFLSWIKRRKKQEEVRKQNYSAKQKDNSRIVRSAEKTVAEEEEALRKAMEEAGCYSPHDIAMKIEELYQLRGVER